MFFFRFKFLFSDASKSQREVGELIKTSSLDDRPDIGNNDKSPAALTSTFEEFTNVAAPRLTHPELYELCD
jgi:hypothetical protein